MKKRTASEVSAIGWLAMGVVCPAVYAVAIAWQFWAQRMPGWLALLLISAVVVAMIGAVVKDRVRLLGFLVMQSIGFLVVIGVVMAGMSMVVPPVDPRPGGTLATALAGGLQAAAGNVADIAMYFSGALFLLMAVTVWRPERASETTS